MCSAASQLRPPSLSCYLLSTLIREWPLLGWFFHCPDLHPVLLNPAGLTRPFLHSSRTAVSWPEAQTTRQQRASGATVVGLTASALLWTAGEFELR